MSPKPKYPLILVLGATGTGKSKLAIELAKRFNGEIINGDAMQLYDGLPLTTNKVTKEEQEGIPHHLLGCISVREEPWTVGLFKKRAQGVIQEIRASSRLPIVVGGTHYYTQSLLFKDVLIGDDTNYTTHALKQRFPVLNGPDAAVLDKLREVDPIMADKWHPGDTRRIRRSLEIYLTTGRKASDIYAEQHARKQAALEHPLQLTEATLEERDSLLLWVHAEKSALVERLNHRVERMIDVGLLDEARTLHDIHRYSLDHGCPIDVTKGIWVSIGYSEFKDYLQAQADTTATAEDLQKLLELAIEKTKGATRRYAKRQVRWIRLQLLPGLQRAGSRHRLYLLDGTDISAWTSNVANPAWSLVEKFLQGQARPEAQSLSALAAQFLDSAVEKEVAESDEEAFRRECTHCQVICTSCVTWEAHAKGRRHRAALKLVSKGCRPATQSCKAGDDMNKAFDGQQQ